VLAGRVNALAALQELVEFPVEVVPLPTLVGGELPTVGVALELLDRGPEVLLGHTHFARPPRLICLPR
jgi:hypothetical protein